MKLVGVLCADEPHDARTQACIADLKETCALGVKRISLGRFPGLGDAKALRATSAMVREHVPAVLHGHGAKGGVLSRFAMSDAPVARIYTPHGGSVHYAANSVFGRLFGFAERMMLTRTDGLIFESEFARSAFARRYGALPANTHVVHNGLAPNEFETLTLGDKPADFLFLGEIRALKGVFTLLDAVAGIAAERNISVDVVGDGPDMAAFRASVEARSLSGSVNILGPLPARVAFARARAVVLPSHHDSFPYVALEAAAAGKPLVATSTGGIPEIFGPLAARLVEPAKADALQTAMERFLDDDAQAMRDAQELRLHVRECFSLKRMVDEVGAVYATALEGGSARMKRLRNAPPLSKMGAAE